jgi:ribosomal protein S1
MEFSEIEHKIVNGTIISITEDKVIVNIGDDCDGIIPGEEFKYNPYTKEGEQIEVYVKGKDAEDNITLSYWEARSIRTWEKLTSAYNNNDTIERCYAHRIVHGGLRVNVLGEEAFMPNSEVDAKENIDLKDYLKKKLDVKIIKLNSSNKNIVVSHKKVVEEGQEVLNQLEKGLILEGTVKKLKDFGAFVDIGGGVTGLVFTKDISWCFVKNPDDILEEGGKVKVVVVDFNEDKTKISLSIKLAYPNPWDDINGYHIGDHVTGKVVNLTTYGAFIEMQPGVEGLLHKSEISWNTNRPKASDFFKIGDKVDAVIIDLDRKSHKISLSVRQLSADPWQNVYNLYRKGDIVNISIERITDKAINCIIDGKYNAVCLSRNIPTSINEKKSNLKVGDTCNAKITLVDKDNRVIFVSIKAIESEIIDKEYDTLLNYRDENKPVKAKIVSFNKAGALHLQLTEHFLGKIGKNELCWHKRINGPDYYKVGQEINVIITSVNKNQRLCKASVKRLEVPVWEYFVNTYKKGDKISAQITSEMSDGSLELRTFSGLYCIIREEDLFKREENPHKTQTVKAEIIDIAPKTHTIYLSLRILELEAVDEYSKQLQHATDYNAQIVSINDDEIVIDIDGHKGFISRENATRSQDVSLHDIVHEGQTKKVWYLSCTEHKLQFLLKEVRLKEYPKELFDKDIDEILEDLDIRINEFVFEINSENKAVNLFQARYDDDDFKGEGKLLIDRFNGEQLHPQLDDDKLAPGFYFGHLQLRDIKDRRDKKNPYLFKLVDVTKLEGDEVNPYKYENQLAFLQQADPSTNMSIASLLDEVGINLYKNKDRMFYELLQNADDASAEYGVQMRVQVTDNYVIISHNGYPFNADDFKSITSAAQSTKKNKKQNTGYKGIGFKSVFSNSSKVLIKSGGFFFMFDKNNEEFKDFDTFYKKRNEGVDWKKFIRKYTNAYVKFNSTPSIPWQLLPIWVDSMPEDLKGTRFDDGANVDIALKLDSNTAEYSEAISKIVNSPKFMLFLRHTRGIELSDGRVITKDKDGSHIFIQSTSIKGNTIESFIVVDDDKVEVNDDYFKRCGFDLFKKEMVLANGDREMSLWRRHEDGTEENLSGSIPNKIASSENTIISMAVPTDDNLVINPLTSDEENRIYAYLPLRERRFKFHFYLNADFILASDREQIQGDNLWNQFLFYNVGKRIVTWVKQVASKEQPNYLNLLQEELFPEEGADVEDIKPLAHQYNRGYKEALETEKFILGHDGEWHSQDEIIYDESGLSELITPELFCMIVGTDKKLPHPSIDSSFLNNKNLLPAIEHLSTTDVLKSILSKEVSVLVKERCAYRNMPLEQRNKVEDWLKLKCNNYSEKVTTIVRYLPIFTFNGRLKSISECMNDSKNVILTDEVLPIKDIIEHSGLAISEENLSKSKLRNIIADKILPQLESDSFKRIVNVTSKSVDNELNSEEKVKLYTHYSDTDNKHKYGIKDSQLKGWTLFRNINGVHSTLAQLAHVEDGEDPIQFLSDYTIDDNEYKSMVETAIVLANGEPVYSLIIRNWDNITAKVTSEDDAIALYELVNKFFKKFNDTDGVFHKDNIRNLSTVYYSKEKKFISPDQILLFKDLSDDSPLRNVFEKLVALPIANEVIASTFSTTPFFNGFNDILKIDFNNNIDLTKEEISLIIESCEGKERDLFSRYYIVPVGAGNFTLVKLRKDEYQYYSSNLNIKNMMAPIKNYHILPDDFKELADTSNNIVTGESLVKIIFDYYKDFTLNQVVADISNDDDYVELEKLSQIEDFDISKIRNKFYIKSADVSCSLNEIHLQKDISVAGHTFTKVDLVPGQDKTTNLATKIRTKLEGRDFKKAWLDKLFGVEQSSQDAAKEMFDKLNKSNYVLDNGKQLAFMLMYAKANGVNVVAKVETLSVNNPTNDFSR